MEQKQHAYGYIPDTKDDRDYSYQVTHTLATLPANIDLRNWCSPVRDQGQLGSCTGFALVVGLCEFLERKSGSKRFTGLSPMFVYYKERVMENTVFVDNGAEIRDGLKALNKFGVCPERDDPYLIDKFTKPPTKVAINAAKKNTIHAYHRLNGILAIQSALASGQGVVLGMLVYESFESGEVAKTGIMPMPERGEQILGGHAVFCCGYKADPEYAGGGALIIKNSWGKDWGADGFFFMPYSFVTRSRVSDAWTGA